MLKEEVDFYPGSSFLNNPQARAFCVEDFSDEEVLMIRTGQEFCQKEVLPLVERIDAQEEGLMPALIRKAGDLGLCGIDSPEHYGGLGLDKNLSARILEFMSFNGSFSVTYGITSGISQLGISLFGSEDQKSRYLPGLTSGQTMGAYALSEPDSGSDALSLTTRAEWKGDHYVLNGTKMWISNAKWANVFLVMAKTGEGRISAFLVDRNLPGVTVGREEHKLGLKGSSTARLILENVRVEPQDLLYEEGLGHRVALNALNIGRFKLASMSLGPARDALYHAAKYATQRKQFGKQISSFGLIKSKFAISAALLYAAESMIYRTGNQIDQAFKRSDGTASSNIQAAEEFSVECSLCKVFATEAESTIIDEALQVFGGYGFTEEFPIARHYRDARVSRIYEGTNEINRLFISARYLKKAVDQDVREATSTDSFVTQLARKALGVPQTSQTIIASQSDLLMLAYAEQSASLRAKRTSELNRKLAQAFQQICNQRAMAAFQLIDGAPITCPKTSDDLESLGSEIIESMAS